MMNTHDEPPHPGSDPVESNSGISEPEDAPDDHNQAVIVATPPPIECPPKCKGHLTPCATLTSIASITGCHAKTLRDWTQCAEQLLKKKKERSLNGPPAEDARVPLDGSLHLQLMELQDACCATMRQVLAWQEEMKEDWILARQEEAKKDFAQAKKRTPSAWKTRKKEPSSLAGWAE
ncbi:hypothetical protein OH76DRAFT_1405841 [Lentinus brumalis]|uniref:Uncharacterized protein n=1 Tax=Lentinus brumalis TaxID=2498619 RepID=A0A371D4P0_9APHY|nr:hypothetical protein OH76DRAFT_1405841 [Polyporus brumalis]